MTVYADFPSFTHRSKTEGNSNTSDHPVLILTTPVPYRRNIRGKPPTSAI